METCKFPGCTETAVACCDPCETLFCEDHGSKNMSGGSVSEEAAACWQCVPDAKVPLYLQFRFAGPCGGVYPGEHLCEAGAGPVNVYGQCPECQGILQDEMSEAETRAYGNWR